MPVTSVDGRLCMQVWRSLLDVARNWSMLLMACCVALIFGIFVGLVFWNLETDIAGVQNRAGAIFFTLVFLDLLAVTSIDSLLNERAVIRKEVRLGYYPAFMYMIAKTLVDAILLRALPALLFGLPVYFMAKLSPSSAKTMMFMFVLVTFAIATQLQAMVIVEYSRRAGTATVVFVMVLVISMLFGGFLVNADSTHPGVAWVQYLSVIFYAFEAMAVNEFKVWLHVNNACILCFRHDLFSCVSICRCFS
jgi:ATP-binding cassette, subfamily G (WHITE), member 2